MSVLLDKSWWSQWQGLSFHNFTVHTLFDITSSVISWKNAQRLTLHFQASVLSLQNTAESIIGLWLFFFFKASNCTESLERFQAVGKAKVVGVKDAASDPHDMTGSFLILHLCR